MPLLIVVAAYLLGTFPTYLAARARNADFAFAAFVPIWNVFLLYALTQDEPRGSLGGGLLLLVLLVIPLANLVAWAWAWARIAEQTYQASVLGWLSVIPPLTVLMPWYLAIRAVRLG